jgi:hypothetical protein
MSRENIFESKTTMADAGAQEFCRTDMTSEEARYYRKAPLPGERKNPMLETQHVERPRKGHGY